MTLIVSLIGTGLVAIALMAAGVNSYYLYPICLCVFVGFVWMLHKLGVTE